MAIEFFKEELEKSYPIDINSELLEEFVSFLIVKRGLNIGDISYIFCDDEYLLNINREYLDHDYYTDIITFDYVEGDVVSGDIFVSLDRVVDNAKEYNKELGDEFIRVISHGILHLFGIKDKEPKEREEMEREENIAIEYYNKKFKDE